MLRTATLLLACTTLAAAGEPTLWERLSNEFEAAARAADGALVVDPDGTGVPTPGTVVGMPPRVGIRVAAERTLVVFPRQDASPRARREVQWPDGSRRKLRHLDGDEQLGVDVYEVVGEPPPCDRALDLDGSPLRRGELLLGVGEGRCEPHAVARTEVAGAPLATEGGAGIAVLLGPRGTLRGLRAEGAGLMMLRGRTVPSDVGVGESLAPVRLPVRLEFLPTRISPRIVPASAILRAVRDVDGFGRIRTPYLGVVLGNRTDGAVVVTSVIAGSPAAKAGLAPGDRIRAIDGVRVTDADAATRLIRLQWPGSRVELDIAAADESPVVVSVVLGDATGGPPRVVTPEDAGLHAVDLDPALLDYLDLPADTHGVLVKGIEDRSAAATAGLRRDDVIVAADGRPVRDLDALRAAFAEAEGALALRWMRDGDERTGSVGLRAKRR